MIRKPKRFKLFSDFGHGNSRLLNERIGKPKRFKRLVVDFGHGNSRLLNEQFKDRKTMFHGYEARDCLLPPRENFIQFESERLNPVFNALKNYESNSVDEWRFNLSLVQILLDPRLDPKTAQEFYRVIKNGGKIHIMERKCHTPREYIKLNVFIESLKTAGFEVEITHDPEMNSSFEHHADTLEGSDLGEVFQITATKPLKKK